jgi:hypothetical protein
LDGIKRDKIKKKYFKNNYNIDILFLWEIDIIENELLCKELIKKYIKNKGKIKRYNSCDYIIKNNKLKLNDGYNKLYMEWEFKDLKNIFHPQLKRARELRKKSDAWITFNCENCGKETTQKKINYKLKEHHFCSYKCSYEFRSQLIDESKHIKFCCEYCGKETEQLLTYYNKFRHHFCSKECSSKFRIDKIETTCAYCGSKIFIIKSKYKEGSNNYCNESCYKKSRKKEYTNFKCDYCGKDTSQPFYRFNKSKHHFCCQDCMTKFRNKI